LHVQANNCQYSEGTMLDLTTDKPISLATATALVPPGRSGRKTHLSTLLRWITKGAKGPDGEVVRLEAVRLGGRWMTSRGALQRFAERLTPSPEGADSPTVQTPAAKRRAAKQEAIVDPENWTTR
jgi:hypothetical protein